MSNEQEAPGLAPDQAALMDILHRYVQNPMAIQWLEDLGYISQLFDDLVDGDKPVTANRIYEAMIAIFGRHERNPFYRANFEELNPMVVAAVNQWIQATDAERATDDRKVQRLRVAFVTRSSLTPIIKHVVFMERGWDIARRAAYELDAVVFDEPFEDYMSEHVQA